MNALGLQALSDRWPAARIGPIHCESNELELGMHSLALAAQHVLCAAPFLVAMSAITRTLHMGDVALLLSDTMGLRGDAQHEIMQLFRVRTHDGAGAFITGFLISFVFATGVSLTMQRTFERIWRLPHADLLSAWRHLVWALMTSVLFASALWVNTATRNWNVSATVEGWVEALTTGFAAFGYYWWTQRILLRGKARWGQLLPGAVLIGLGTTVLILAVQLLAPNEITEQVADYGLVGAAFILALVLVAFSTILLWGVFLGRDLSRWLVARRFDAAHSSDNPDATSDTDIDTDTAIDTGAAPAVLEGPVRQPTAAL
ncbi:hypothetical protein GCM10027599_02010 [Yimella radicis]